MFLISTSQSNLPHSNLVWLIMHKRNMSIVCHRHTLLHHQGLFSNTLRLIANHLRKQAQEG